MTKHNSLSVPFSIQEILFPSHKMILGSSNIPIIVSFMHIQVVFNYLSLSFACSVLLSEFTKFADEESVLEFAQVPFNHPLYIMYSSGTTGPPKCLVHSVGVL